MAINVQYQPNAQVLANAGYVAGAGMYRQAMQEMQQRERMQMRSIQASQQDAAMNRQFTALRDQMQNRFAQDRQAQNFRNQIDFAQEQDKLLQNRAKMENQMRLEQMQMQMEQRKKEMELQGLNALERDQASFFFDAGGETMKQVEEMLANGMQFTPEDQAKYNKIRSDMRAIEDKNGNALTPLSRARHIFELAQQLPVPSIPKVDLEADFAENTIERVDSDGVTRRYQKTIRNGVSEFKVLYDGKTLSPEEQAAQKMPSWNYFNDTEKMFKIRADAIRALTREVSENGVTKKVLPSEEEIAKEVDAFLSMTDGMYRKRYENNQTDNATPEPGKIKASSDGSVYQWVDE